MMCGRFVTAKAPSVYVTLFGIDAMPATPNYNVAPTQKVAAVRLVEDRREAVLLRWGLIPFWAKDKKTNFINARSETVLEKPAFRAAVKRRRCLIPADGYYEWRKEGKAKLPVYYRRRDDQPFAFAGLWDCWKGEGEPLESFTIITTAANELARAVHDRMPVILTDQAAQLWLDPEIEDVAALAPLLAPYPAEAMDAYPVRPLVNSVKNNGPDLIVPLLDR
jgi:putative SOS response-associated peptidase YedK